MDVEITPPSSASRVPTETRAAETPRTRLPRLTAALTSLLSRSGEESAQVEASSELVRLRESLETLREQLVGAVETLQETHTLELSRRTAFEQRMVQIVRQVAEGDSFNVRRLWALRADPSYELPFECPDPLVSIVIATFDRWEMLRDRSIPSALSQTHRNIEVIVVGDSSPDIVAETIDSFGDSRLRFANLSVRGPYPEDEMMRWRMSGIGPGNEALRLARGQWIATCDDDDAMRPDHVEKLLEGARAHRAEVCYGQLLQHTPDGDSILGAFPPQFGNFGWQMTLRHAGLRDWVYERTAALFDEPGDWYLCQLMLHAGVRFHMIDDVVAHYYPSGSWGHRDVP